MTETMRTLRFHEYGEPSEVLRLETIEAREPGPGRVRIVVQATGLAPADWALCRGLFAGDLPRGIGCDVSGTVDAIGDGVEGIAVGDVVFGTADWAHYPFAGASEKAVMNRWFPVPTGLDLVSAAALPMTVDTAYTHLNWLGLEAGKTILIHGAGSTIGFAAVQIALLNDMHVIATAGDTYAPRLRDLGATVTPYGHGMAGRILGLNPTPVDLAFDAAPVGGSLPDLIQIVGGDPKRVLTASDFAAAAELGARDTFHEDRTKRVEILPEYAQRTAEGTFSVPIGGTFPLDEWKSALEVSQSRHAHGKLLLLPNIATRVEGHATSETGG
jgi:NADPH:quinone reductase-like Zn-dependent oxidoreductase